MSVWGRYDQRMGEDEVLDDATVEKLLTGRYQGEAPDLVAMSQLLERVRASAEQHPPRPSAALARILSPPSPQPVRDQPAAGVWERLRRSRNDRCRPRSVRLPVGVATVSTVLVVTFAGAGSARLLPGPAQDLAGKVVQTVTPFEFPEREEGESEPVEERAAPDRTSEPGTRSANGSPLPQSADPGSARSQPIAGGGPGIGPNLDGAAGVPTPSTTAGPQRSATVTGSDGEPSTGASGTPPPPPPPPAPPRPSRLGFTADLTGAPGGDPDGRGTAFLDVSPGREELCLTVVVSGAAHVTSAHVHAGREGGAPVVVFMEPPNGGPASCVSVPGEIIKKIQREPGAYHVDLHTTELPDGALQGQLTKEVRAPKVG